MEDTSRDTWGQAFGAALRAHREQMGMRAEDVSTLMRTYGLAWSRSVVTAVESGRRTVHHDEFLLLCGAFVRKPWEWFEGEGTIQAGERTLTFQQVRALYQGEQWLPVGEPPTEERKTELRVQLDTAVTQVHDRFLRVWPDSPHPVDYEQAWIVSGGEAEFHAARRLSRRHGVDLDPVAISLYSWGLWGRGLTAERDARVAQRVPEGAGERAVQAHRGHVTRELLRGLDPVVVRFKEYDEKEASDGDDED